MDLNKKGYFVIFDTNILFRLYEKKADFTTFSFSSTYSNVIDMINQLDIYEQVTIVIPEVTLNEMKKQIIDAHDKKIEDFKSYINKWVFPEFSISEIRVDNYQTFIEEKISAYKRTLRKGMNDIIVLPIPSDNRFKGIIQRAFDKSPPFEGKEKNSDKGFKDVLIWESILEFVSLHKNANIIFYTRDNGFKEALINEFCEMHPDASISILSSEDEIKNTLEEWAKKIDIYKYQPIEDYIENRDFIEWLESANFEIQMIEHEYGLVEKNRLIIDTALKLKYYDNIKTVDNSDGDIDYSLDATIEVSYTFKGGGLIKEIIDIVVLIECISDGCYSVKNAYRVDNGGRGNID